MLLPCVKPSILGHNAQIGPIRTDIRWSNTCSPSLTHHPRGTPDIFQFLKQDTLHPATQPLQMLLPLLECSHLGLLPSQQSLNAISLASMSNPGLLWSCYSTFSSQHITICYCSLFVSSPMQMHQEKKLFF